MTGDARRETLRKKEGIRESRVGPYSRHEVDLVVVPWGRLGGRVQRAMQYASISKI